MFRVLKVMAILVALSLVSAVAVQPAYATSDGVPALQDNTAGSDDGNQTFGNSGDPGDNDTGEGDPDSVGGGYGARTGDSDLTGLLGGLFGSGNDDMTFEEFIYLMMLQFMPNP